MEFDIGKRESYNEDTCRTLCGKARTIQPALPQRPNEEIELQHYYNFFSQYKNSVFARQHFSYSFTAIQSGVPCEARATGHVDMSYSNVTCEYIKMFVT